MEIMMLLPPAQIPGTERALLLHFTPIPWLLQSREVRLQDLCWKKKFYSLTDILEALLLRPAGNLEQTT